MQIECGWAFCSVLTKSGDVLVFWPSAGEMNARITAKNEEMDRDGDKKAIVGNGDSIPCITWNLHMDPTRLPSLPPLPTLPEAVDQQETDDGIYLIQIAGLDNNIIGLTNKGHVLKYGHLEDETTVSSGRWEYVSLLFLCFLLIAKIVFVQLPNFSQVDYVRKHPTFCSSEDDTSTKALDPPESMQITHVSSGVFLERVFLISK